MNIFRIINAIKKHRVTRKIAEAYDPLDIFLSSVFNTKPVIEMVEVNGIFQIKQ